ncbi:hypothetical protein Q4E93_04690 [Flavitalea sp. BT771]|uniref:hypothetical protein n=1 Tax=Flavitalea sp. BT771 TaxID=3063329 RepID=UPI0026E1D1FD|nr:hypothetical protein [Flavitalea sp. BT771]MDO6429866.1 hypothetical protein [Flavitalea sp. BT771]MDV6218006.1 hypothetical protein [Flavitalea sp. BT771]
MKYISTLFLLAMSSLISPAFAQLNNGGLNAGFGVDADTRANYMKYGMTTGAVISDDWFSPSLSGNNVIDTSNAAYYLSLLQGGANMGFSKRMSALLYARVSGRLWLDAVYGRDYVATNPLTDSTAFTIASKNGDNPGVWAGGSTNFPDKNDLVDAFAHMRRNGTSVYDSLWLFTGVSTVGVSGSRYFDIELYKKNFSYNGTTGAFSSAGTEAGHTQWLFDASGNITQTGDLILAVNYSPGAPPVVDVRIWVSSTTFTTVVPAYFNFGASFDGASASPAYGYASILSKTGATNFGSGIANYSATAAQDTTYATPWGTELSTKNWGTQYQTLQLIEMGLNLTRIGVDPALYTASGLSPCQPLFSDIFFKSRSSNSFTSNMQDFIVPLVFVQNPVMDYSLKPDTLRCNHTAGSIQITNNSTAGYYTWQTANGAISGANTDSSQINVTKPGTYIVSASPALGCPATRKDTVVIPIDTFPPVASIAVAPGSSLSYLQFYGGNTSASNYSTPFGGSNGLLWNWSGPQSFASTIQNPRTVDTAGVWGTYQLIVTEKRNGCKDTAIKTISMYDFIVLSTDDLKVKGVYSDHSIVVTWEDHSQDGAGAYEIERYTGNDGYKAIGTVLNGGGNAGQFSFTDNDPLQGNNRYRIKATGKNGQIYYSGVVTVAAGRSGLQSIYLAGSAPGKGVMTLIVNADADSRAEILLYNLSGQRLWDKPVQFGKGMNTFGLSTAGAQVGSVQVIFILVEGRVAYSQKIMF